MDNLLSLSISNRKGGVCTKCLKVSEEATEQCECGNKMFVYSDMKDSYHIVDGKVMCSCRYKHGLRRFMHMNYTNRSVYGFECTVCGNVFTIESYKDWEL